MKSIWLEGFSSEKKKPALEKTNVDVCIIGGGIAGISAAFELKDSGLDILLIDKGTIGFGVTAYTTAKISYLQELPYSKIKKMHGVEAAKLYLSSQKQAYQQIKNNIENNHIDCNYQEGKEFIFTDQKSRISKLKEEEAFLNQCETTTYSPTISVPFPYQYGFGVTGATFHPLKYLYGLKNLLKDKVTIYENLGAKGIEKKKGKYEVQTDAGNINATYAIVCTHYPFFIYPGWVPLKSHMEKSYIIASKTKDVHNFSCITAGTPMHSIRYFENYILYGGNPHTLTEHLNEEENIEKMKEQFQSLFNQSIDYLWTNQDIIPNDGLPFIGALDDNLYLATGFHTWGMTNGTIAGTVIADEIQKGYSIYGELFDVKRKWNLYRIGHLFVDVARYGKVFFKTTLIKNPKFYQEHVYVTHESGKRIGVYTDQKGIEHKVLNHCPHMKCNLIFNKKEKTWDCPCHSSRFDIDGNVIKGPSVYSIKIEKDSL